MTLRSFRTLFFDKYRGHDFETQQKAYLLFWTCGIASIIGFAFTIINIMLKLFFYEPGMTDHRLIYLCSFIFIVGIFGMFNIWKKHYYIVSKIIFSLLVLIVIFLNYISIERDYLRWGIITTREGVYVLLAWIALFNKTRNSFVFLSVLIIICPTLVLIFMKPDINSQVNYALNMFLLNTTSFMICVAILIFFKRLITDNALQRMNKELENNRKLNQNLDKKVQERTRKIKEQREEIKIEQKRTEKAYELLSKYVAPQLADTITNGKIDSIWQHNRKKLTLFFSDIKDFTKITDALEPEDMANLLNEYLTEMNKIINKYQGTLAQVIGDGLYVFFGAPKSTNDKDHAIRCLKMAIDMQSIMTELNKEWFTLGIDTELQIRCGINTGMATVGGYGSSERKEYTAMGMQVNIAARLESACKPGHILINHTTWTLIKDDIPCIEKGQIKIKGYHLPVRVYEVETTQVN